LHPPAFLMFYPSFPPSPSLPLLLPLSLYLSLSLFSSLPLPLPLPLSLPLSPSPFLSLAFSLSFQMPRYERIRVQREGNSSASKKKQTIAQYSHLNSILLLPLIYSLSPPHTLH